MGNEQKWKIDFSVNGRRVEASVPPMMTLADLLREQLGLLGTKVSCNEGECGSCTVIVNGKAVNSCLVLAAQVQDADVWTIEGMESNGSLSILQDTFLKVGAVQCGYCTPGFIMSATALLAQNPDPTRAEIQEAVEGNLCRCTGYQKIVQAIEVAAKEIQAAGDTL